MDMENGVLELPSVSLMRPFPVSGDPCPGTRNSGSIPIDLVLDAAHSRTGLDGTPNRIKVWGKCEIIVRRANAVILGDLDDDLIRGLPRSVGEIERYSPQSEKSIDP